MTDSPKPAPRKPRWNRWLKRLGWIALTREPSPRLEQCELTLLTRQAIDVSRAIAQHAEYRAALARLGCRVVELPALPDMPDGVFVEDTAVVLDEIAILTRPGAQSRRPEVESVELALREHRPIARIDAPGFLDGGDVLCVGKSIYVGRSTRTDTFAIEQFEGIVAPYGYEVTAVDVTGCLHLKTAATYAGRDTVIVNPEWIRPELFARHAVVEVADGEPNAANVVVIGDAVLCSAASPRTNEILADRGFQLEVVASDEVAKAEGALTCCSLVFRDLVPEA